jgi:hypothetical protein
MMKNEAAYMKKNLTISQGRLCPSTDYSNKEFGKSRTEAVFLVVCDPSVNEL